MSGALTDADLVWAAREGDPSCLGVLLERHRASMQAVAFSLLGYGPEAQDAVQDAMLIALRKLHELRDPAACGAWLCAIVRNACRMRLRAARPVVADDLVLRAVPDQAPSPDELLDQHALRDWIWHALGQLSAPLQLVVLLRYFTGVTSYAQIAELCGVPVGTVRSRLNQAKQKLSDALLESALTAHADAASHAERWRGNMEVWLSAAERGEGARTLAQLCAPHVSLVTPHGHFTAGEYMLTHIMEHDVADGVRQRLVQVAANQSIAVIECDLLSPDWEPEHCPPALVWLFDLRDERIAAVRYMHPSVATSTPSAALDSFPEDIRL